MAVEYGEVVVRIVNIPDYTPRYTGIYMTGDFNNWIPDDVTYRLRRVRKYSEIRISQPLGTRIHFKFTRGSWDTVEKGSSGEETPNREYVFTEKKDTLFVVIENWRDFVDQKKGSTIVGNIVIIKGFIVPELSTYRRIWIYLPPDYDTANKHYPVLYMQDGQNLFDQSTAFAGEWHIDETMEALFRDSLTTGAIVVGIDNAQSNRTYEYVPWKTKTGGGGGDTYAEFLVNTLKPYIDSKYRTLSDREHTGIAGSSLGGVISLYTALTYPSIFSKVGVFSPAFWIAKQEMIDYINKHPMTKPLHMYFDVGTDEGDKKQEYVDDLHTIIETLSSAGYPNYLMQTIIAEGAQHNEAAWSSRFPGAFLWLFNEE